MGSLLAKFGKSINALKREGIVAGSRKITGYFGVFLKTILSFKTGDILIITGGVGDSARFRAWNVSEELNLHGIKTSVTIADDPLLSRYANKFKIFIFHRVLFAPKISKFFAKIKISGGEIIFETDDLIFDPGYLKQTDYYQNINPLERKSYENGIGGEILKDSYVKTCTTTTSYLAEKLEDYGKKVFIVPNRLSKDDLKTIDVILSERQRVEESNLKGVSLDFARDDKIKIGYFSGTISHNRDFATIEDELAGILEKYPKVELVLAGPLEIGSLLNRFKNRVCRLPFAPRNKHFENVSTVDINLAPLEEGNPFCEAKSELKFFEAGALGIPTVAAATRTFREAIEDGIDGFIASTKEEWFDKLERLVTDGKLRSAMGEKAREKSLRKYTTKNSENAEYHNYLISKLKGL